MTVLYTNSDPEQVDALASIPALSFYTSLFVASANHNLFDNQLAYTLLQLLENLKQKPPATLKSYQAKAYILNTFDSPDLYKLNYFLFQY